MDQWNPQLWVHVQCRCLETLALEVSIGHKSMSVILPIGLCSEANRGRRDRDHMVVGFTTTYTISTYHHQCCEFEYCSGDTTLCDKVYQWLVAGLWWSPGTPVSSTNKTSPHKITEILLKVALNTINQNQSQWLFTTLPSRPTNQIQHTLHPRCFLHDNK